MSKRRGSDPIQVRLDPALRLRLKAEADARMSGNESEVARQALRLYLDLRETHGPHFELIVRGLMQPKETVAA